MIQSRSPQGLRGLKSSRRSARSIAALSQSARTAWIEIYLQPPLLLCGIVAVRKDCVD